MRYGLSGFSDDYTLTYTYDNKANLISEYEDFYSFESRLKTYAYDNANRLIQETNSERDTKITYEYDAVGNLLSKWTKSLQNSDEIRGAQLYAYDKNNRISSAFDGEYSYDASGNLTGDNDGRVYTYDGYDRVKTVQTSAGTIQYTYSTDNLRLSKQTADGLTRFCYDSAGNILMEKTGSTVDKIYLWGNGIEALIVPDDSDIQFYGYLKNAHGDVLTVSQGFYNYAEYDYDAYGNVVACTETGITNPIRYAGYYYDTDTQNYYLINRYYSPYQGRFLTEDTYWNVSNMLYGKFTDTVEKRVYYPAVVQSGNRFTYCGNNPIGWHDPWGLVVSEWDKKHLTEEEIRDIENCTWIWEYGESTNNQSLKDFAHEYAENIRNRHRADNEVGTGDGRTKTVIETAFAGITANPSLPRGGDIAIDSETVRKVSAIASKAVAKLAIVATLLDKLTLETDKAELPQVDYWIAQRDKKTDTVVVGSSVTLAGAVRYSLAISPKSRNDGILAVDDTAAKVLLGILGGPSRPDLPERHGNGEGYYYHYHPAYKPHEHIWILSYFGKE